MLVQRVVFWGLGLFGGLVYLRLRAGMTKAPPAADRDEELAPAGVT